MRALQFALGVVALSTAVQSSASGGLPASKARGLSKSQSRHKPSQTSSSNPLMPNTIISATEAKRQNSSGNCIIEYIDGAAQCDGQYIAGISASVANTLNPCTADAYSFDTVLLQPEKPNSPIICGNPGDGHPLVADKGQTLASYSQITNAGQLAMECIFTNGNSYQQQCNQSGAQSTSSAGLSSSEQSPQPASSLLQPPSTSGRAQTPAILTVTTQFPETTNTQASASPTSTSAFADGIAMGPRPRTGDQVLAFGAMAVLGLF